MKSLGVYAALAVAITMAGVQIAGAQTPDSPGATAIQQNSEMQRSLAEARKLIDRGRAADALKQLDALAAEKPGAAGINTLRGTALYAQSNFAEADTAFDKALKQNPRDEEATQMRGLTLFRLGRSAEAIPLLEAAHNWTPETKTDPSYALALCYIDTHRYDDARHAFASQYGFGPNSAAAYLLAARMLLRRNYVLVAREFGAKALEIDPQLPQAHQLLGEIALAGEHVDEAIAEFEKERARNPLEGSLYDRLGDAYIRAGDYTRAQRALQQALLLEPNTTGPYILLGKALLRVQDGVNAALYLERAEKMDPGNTMTHALLGQAYRMLGRAEDAKRQSEFVQKLQSADK